MMDSETIRVLSTILLVSTPLIIAICGELLTELTGIVNLSLDGTMLLGAMAGFIAAFKTGNVWLGFLAAALIGTLFAFIIAFGSIHLKKDQYSIGFVLTLLGNSLSAYLGQNFTRIPGPHVLHAGIPLLKDIPIIGPIFFDQDPTVYFALALVFITWWWLNHTQPGLRLRCAGERPEAGFARGININQLRYIYTLIGGALAGIAGATYSLNIKLGWSEGHTLGLGWIALAIVIFGSWKPIRGAFGALLFGGSKTLVTLLQRSMAGVSVVLFNITPWVLMIFVLLSVNSDLTDKFISIVPSKWIQAKLRQFFRIRPPSALGTIFESSESDIV